MRRKLFVAVIVVVTTWATVSQAVKELNNLSGAAEAWVNENILNSVVTTAYAREPQPERGATAGPGVAGQGQTDGNEFHWRGQIAAGRVIEVKGVSGNVRAEPTTGNEVEVIANKHARRSDPGSVHLQVLEHAGGVTICAIYPSDDPNHQNLCEVGDRWSSHVHNNDVSVDFIVRVPAGVNFAGRTVNGGVETGALGGNVEAYTVNGDINLSAAGIAEARTVNGSITASLGRANWVDSVKFETINGGITLNLPADLSTEVRAETLNGDIATDFPLTVQGHFSRRKLSGTIGNGGRELNLKTINGSIRLRRT